MPRREGYVLLTLKCVQDDGGWSGECVELGTATSADTLDELQDELVDLVQLHLNALEDARTCAQFLRRHGVVFHRLNTRPRPVRVSVKLGEVVTRIKEPFALA